MFGRQLLPEGLASLPPGPALAGLLGSLDRSRLNGHDMVTVMQARARQVAHDQAELYADMIEVAHCSPGSCDSLPDRQPEVDEFAADEIRAALGWTRRAADCQLDLAWHLVERLPQVWEALDQGRIDLPKARVIIDNTAHLEESTVRRLVDAILQRAGALTTGQLAARIRVLALQMDPDGAKQRYEDGIEDRRVVAEPNPDGTVNLSGYHLPADRALAATERINSLAQSAKDRDDPRTIDQVRADIFLDLLEGCHEGIGATHRGVVDLHVDVATLAGLTESPGEIVGWGPVIADIARQVAARHPHSEWRVTVTDPDDGRVLWNGTTRRRPTAALRRHIEARQRTCVFPGCRASATTSDIDHTHDWAAGGPTLTSNLGPLCRHDHRLKHHGGWQLRQPHPGIYTWSSRLGHSYTVGPQPP